MAGIRQQQQGVAASGIKPGAAKWRSHQANQQANQWLSVFSGMWRSSKRNNVA